MRNTELIDSSSARQHLAPAREWIINGFPPIDFQMHTTWTDGKSTTKEMIVAAIKSGLRAIAITEHVNEQSDYYQSFMNEIRHLKHTDLGIFLYYGLEVSIADYRGHLRTSLKKNADTELFLGVVHSYPKDGGGFYRFADLSRDQALECELRGLTSLANNPSIDVIGHPGGTFYKKFGGFPVQLMAPAFRLAKQNGIAVELNTTYLWDLGGLLDLLFDINPILSFGSDAHCSDDVGSNYKQLLIHDSQRKWTATA